MKKFIIAVILVVVSMVAAEAPRPRASFARQTAAPAEAPYQARGWRPSGPSFNLPVQSQNQQQAPAPAPSYGPPPQEPEQSTTEEPGTTTEFQQEDTTLRPQAENLKASPRKTDKKNSENLEQAPGQFYLVVPQTQNVFYAQAPAPLVAVQRSNLVAASAPAPENQKPTLIPVQALPAFAKIQEIPRVQYASSSSVFTPYSASIIQIYQ